MYYSIKTYHKYKTYAYYYNHHPACGNHHSQSLQIS